MRARVVKFVALSAFIFIPEITRRLGTAFDDGIISRHAQVLFFRSLRPNRRHFIADLLSVLPPPPAPGSEL